MGERLEVLRASNDRPESTDGAAPAEQPYAVRLGLGGRGSGSNVSIEIPVGPLMDDAEPVVVEHVRVRPGKGHSTTRHFRVVKQGDRVLAVIKGAHNDNSLTPRWDEEDFE